jgi:hypothetical protein
MTRKRFLLIAAIVSFAISLVALAGLVNEISYVWAADKKLPLALRLEDGAFTARNTSDEAVHYFVYVHSWGCGSAVQKLEPIEFIKGEDIVTDPEDGKPIFKPSYFEKIGKFNHAVINPGKTAIMWSWPHAMRCLDNNESINFNNILWSFSSAEEAERFFKYVDMYR